MNGKYKPTKSTYLNRNKPLSNDVYLDNVISNDVYLDTVILNDVYLDTVIRNQVTVI